MCLLKGNCTVVEDLAVDPLKRICDLCLPERALHFNDLAKIARSSKRRRAYLYDVTLREGEQSGYVQEFPRDFKLEYACAAAAAGVDAIEVGFPSVLSKETQIIKEISGLQLPVDVVAFARAEPYDIDVVASTGVEKVAIFAPCSDILIKYQLDASRAKLIKMVERAVSYARNIGLRVRFSAQDFSRAKIGFLLDVVSTAEGAGAEDITLADSLGLLTPLTSALATVLIRNHCNLPLGIHCHNDFGMATANAVSAVLAGISWVHVSALGLGERAGIVPVEEIVPCLLDMHTVRLCICPRNIISLVELCESFVGLHPLKSVMHKHWLSKWERKLNNSTNKN